MQPGHAPALVGDIERGVSETIRAEPWQTDTCIGSWHYDRAIYTEHRYKTTGQVVRMLADIVSKNGNLLLSIPVRGDGEIDGDEEAFLKGMAAWMNINQEAIFSTRPWSTYGEGPSTVENPDKGTFGGARDVRKQPYTSEDIRFTKKADTVYAILLAWPADHAALVKTMAEQAPAMKGCGIGAVSLLGSSQSLKWYRDPSGLHVTLPENPPCENAFVLKVQLTQSPPRGSS